jgi:hypothetical protein
LLLEKIRVSLNSQRFGVKRFGIGAGLLLILIVDEAQIFCGLMGDLHALPGRLQIEPFLPDFQRDLRFRNRCGHHAQHGRLRNGSYPTLRKTRFRVLVRLSRTGFHPQGSNKRFLHHIVWESSFSKLLGAIWSSNLKKCMVGGQIRDQGLEIRD